MRVLEVECVCHFVVSVDTDDIEGAIESLYDNDVQYLCNHTLGVKNDGGTTISDITDDPAWDYKVKRLQASEPYFTFKDGELSYDADED
jgi:hypothetical protein